MPALDGLRGIAVVAVLLFHGGVRWAQGGFLGVDVFFVLSGFLITSLLLEERVRSGAIRLSAFWARRARRLLPALLALLAASAAYAAFVASPEARGGIRKDVLATLAYVANWHFIAEQSSYFARTGDPSPLAHTWSLAIEEQFYLVWPLVVLAVARGRRALERITVLAGAGALASAGAMYFLFRPGGDPSRVYYGTDTRAQVILVGAVLAALLAWWRQRDPGTPRHAHTRHSPTGARALAVAGVLSAGAVAAAIAVAKGSDAWLYRGGFLGISVGVAVVIWAVSFAPSGLLARVLSFPALAGVGRISYGLYLWHWPLYLVLDHARTGLTAMPLLAVRLAATTAVSLVSYWVLEMPVRRGAFPRWRAAVALPATVGAVVTAVIATTSIPLATLPASASAAAALSSPPTTSSTHRATRPPLAPGQPPKVMIVGDSVGETLGVGLTQPARRWDIALDNQAILGCGIVRGGPYRYFGAISPELGQCKTWPERWAGLIATHDPDIVFMVVGRWEVMDRVHDGRWTRVGDPSFDDYLTTELEQAVQILSSRGAQIALATTPYFLRGERPDGGRWPEDDPARVDAFNQLLRGVAARHPDTVTIVDLGGHTSVGGVYTKYLNGLLMRYDGVHFTPQADQWLAPWLFPQLLALAPPGSSLEPAPRTAEVTVPPATYSPPRPLTTVRRRVIVATTTPHPPTTAAHPPTTVAHSPPTSRPPVTTPRTTG